MNILKKINSKVKDFFDVRKYKKQRNTYENKYNARNEQYIELLESDRSMLNKNIQLEAQIRDLKKEIKELKRTIEEDMVPKKKKEIKDGK